MLAMFTLRGVSPQSDQEHPTSIFSVTEQGPCTGTIKSRPIRRNWEDASNDATPPAAWRDRRSLSEIITRSMVLIPPLPYVFCIAPALCVLIFPLVYRVRLTKRAPNQWRRFLEKLTRRIPGPFWHHGGAEYLI